MIKERSNTKLQIYKSIYSIAALTSSCTLSYLLLNNIFRNYPHFAPFPNHTVTVNLSDVIISSVISSLRMTKKLNKLRAYCEITSQEYSLTEEFRDKKNKGNMMHFERGENALLWNLGIKRTLSTSELMFNFIFRFSLVSSIAYALTRRDLSPTNIGDALLISLNASLFFMGGYIIEYMQTLKDIEWFFNIPYPIQQVFPSETVSEKKRVSDSHEANEQQTRKLMIYKALYNLVSIASCCSLSYLLTRSCYRSNPELSLLSSNTMSFSVAIVSSMISSLRMTKQVDLFRAYGDISLNDYSLTQEFRDINNKRNGYETEEVTPWLSLGIGRVLYSAYLMCSFMSYFTLISTYAFAMTKYDLSPEHIIDALLTSLVTGTIFVGGYFIQHKKTTQDIEEFFKIPSPVKQILPAAPTHEVKHPTVPAEVEEQRSRDVSFPTTGLRNRKSDASKHTKAEFGDEPKAKTRSLW